MTSFNSVAETQAQLRMNEHDGYGPILFRRLLERPDSCSPIDFADYTIVHPGSEIGWHQHVGSEELYFIVAGTPLVRVNERQARLGPGSLSLVHDGGSHALINDTQEDVALLVVQIRR